MWEKLRANAHKRHWSEVSESFLYRRLLDELGELAEALGRGDGAAIQREAADVANFAMMLADNARAREVPAHG